MKVLIFGAGSVGSVIGGFLARTGHEVSLVGRPWHLDVIRKQGLTITGIWGDYRIKAFDVFPSADAVKKAGQKFDLIVLTVKAYDTAEAVEELAPLMDDHTMLLSFQNGLGNIETILKKVRPEQFLIGRVIFGAEIEPGLVRVTVSAEPLAIGPAPGAQPLLSAARMASTLSNAKLQTVAVDDILPVIWAKVIYNCALNGICSVHEMTYGDILKRPDTQAQMRQVVRECYAVAAKQAVRLEPSSVDAYIELLENRLIPRTAAHYPSMLQDLQKGKRIDIDALNGAICRLGSECGVPTPENQRVVDSIKSKYF